MRSCVVAPLAAVLLLGSSLLLSSCSGLPGRRTHQHASLPQASNPATGGSQIALAATRATAVAAIQKPVTTVRLGLALAWIRTRELVASNLPVQSNADPPPELPGTPEFEQLLDRHGFPPAHPGTLRCLVDGPGFFPEFDRLAERARHSIDVQIYIFDNDDVGVRCANLLRRRSSEIPVRVLLDDIGTTVSASIPPATNGPPGFVPPMDMISYLGSGSELHARRSLNPWLVSDHTKLIVFDGQTALLGGMNIGREYFSEWHDLMVRIDGPVVAALADEFDQAWRRAGVFGEFARLAGHRARRVAPARPGDIPLRLLRTDTLAGEHQIMNATLLAIRASRQRVWIETPYFASDEVSRAVEAAARRGVDVRVILPQRGDSNIMDIGNLATARSLINAGARVFYYPGMTHAKLMLCDGWANLGSANLDTLSLRINRELNIAFSAPVAVRHLEESVFLPDFLRSRRMTLEETNSPIAPLAESIADQL